MRSDRWVHAKRTESDRLVARTLRPLLMDYDLCSASAAHCSSPTYFGQKSCSPIDHYFVPVQIAAAISRVTTLMKSMWALQLVRIEEPRYHAPLAMTVRLSLLHPSRTLHPRACRDQMMEALTYSHKREECLRRLGEKICEVPEEEWQEEEERRMSTDGHWARIASAVQSAAEEVFSYKHPERKELSEKRKELLLHRRRLRLRIGEVDEDELETVRLELTLVARRTTRLRKREMAKRRALILDDIRDAWRRRRLHSMYRHTAKLAGNRRAPRQRVHAAQPAAEPGLDVWEDFLHMRGWDFGLAAIRTQPFDMEEEHYRKIRDDADEPCPWHVAEM